MIQLISETKEEFLSSIFEGVKKILDDFKKEASNKQDEILSRQETANLLKIDKSTLSNWTKEGKLTSYGLGGRVYYKRSEIDKALVKIT